MNRIGLLVYSFLVQICQFAFLNLGVKVWARNSVVFRKITPFISDIDLTLYCKGMSKRQLLRVEKLHRTLKGFIPLLGEANYITDERLPFILTHLNCYELSRDPILIKKFVGTKSVITENDTSKFVFLVRMLVADLENLRYRPRIRKNKWRFHLESTDISADFNPFTVADLLNRLNDEIFSKATTLPIKDCFRHLLSNPSLSVDEYVYELLKNGGEHEKMALVLFPIRWITITNRNSSFPASLSRISSLNEFERNALIEHLRWELSYLCMRSDWADEDETIIAHLARIFAVIRFVSYETSIALADSFAKTGLVTEAELLSLRRAGEVSRTFCITPWIGVRVDTDGRFGLCGRNEDGIASFNINQMTVSEVLRSEKVQSIKAMMLRGEEVDYCRECYREESLGLKSHRIKNNENYDSLCSAEDLRNVGIIKAEFGFGNQCELQCLKCVAGRSSSWNHFAQTRLGGVENLRNRELADQDVFRWYTKGPFVRDLPAILSSLREITFFGGDGFSSDGHREFLELFISSGASRQVKLTYRTNGLVDPTYVDLWRSFAKVDIRVWLDDFGERDSYLRFPSKWQSVISSLDEWESLPEYIDVHVGYRIHALNVYYLPEIVEWGLNQKYNKIKFRLSEGRIIYDLVEQPGFLSIQSCPPEFKMAVKDKLNVGVLRKHLKEDDVDKIVMHMDAKDTYDGRVFRIVKALDGIRGTSFERSFPEIVSYWDSRQRG